MKNRVTEYLVCKAINNGVPLHLETLMLATQRPADEVRNVLIKLHPELFGTPGVDIPYRKTATITELVAYARPFVERHGIDYILTWQYCASACACMGPRDGDPLCPCAMSLELAKPGNKASVAAVFMEEQNDNF